MAPMMGAINGAHGELRHYGDEYSKGETEGAKHKLKYSGKQWKNSGKLKHIGNQQQRAWKQRARCTS